MRLPGIRLPRWLPRAAGAALGCVFLVAAGAKAVDPVGFAAGIEEYGIIRGALPTRLLATAIIAAEAALGACLLLGVWYRRALAAATLMLLIFGAVIGWAWASGQQHGCGCFGSLVERTPSQALAEDGGFLILAILGFAWRPSAATARGSAHWYRRDRPNASGRNKRAMSGSVRVADSSSRRITRPQAPPDRWCIITMARQPRVMLIQNT